MDGHRDFKTTLIYADYSPSASEVDLVNLAFGGKLVASEPVTAEFAATEVPD